MIVTEYTGYRELIPENGKVLTDGENIAKAIMMPLSGDSSAWYEIDKPENYDEQDD